MDKHADISLHPKEQGRCDWSALGQQNDIEKRPCVFSHMVRQITLIPQGNSPIHTSGIYT